MNSVSASVPQTESKLRDSEVSWIGRMRSDWESVLLRLVARIESGHTPSRPHPEYWVPSECVIPWFSLADVWQLRDGRNKYLGETSECISEIGIQNSSARLLPAGTVVLSRTASVGFSGIMPRPMATTQDFVNWVCGDRITPDYLMWLFRAMKPEFERLMMGSTHQTIYMPDVRQLRGPVPRLQEQRAIAAFLDRETARIDALSEKKRRQIELLHEKRAALISHAVTKGLDPSAPMKDSGIEWLGEIPKHWDALPLKRRWQVIDCKHRTVPFLDEGIPLASIGEVKEIDLDLSRAKRTLADEYSELIEGGRQPSRGDIIFSRNATVGAAAYVNTDELFCMGQDVCLITSPNQNQRYLIHQLRGPAVISQIESRQVGATFFRINVAQIKEFELAVPPRTEQDAIVRHCDHALEQEGTLAGKVGSSIELLHEYRTAIISAAVTGKIDVRQEVT